MLAHSPLPLSSAAPGQPADVTVSQTGPGLARVSWGAPPTPGGTVIKYVTYYAGSVGQEGNNTYLDLSGLQGNLQGGGSVNVTVIAVGPSLPSVGTTVVYREGGCVPVIAKCPPGGVG